jgi:hypothetical protein
MDANQLVRRSTLIGPADPFNNLSISADKKFTGGPKTLYSVASFASESRPVLSVFYKDSDNSTPLALAFS